MGWPYGWTLALVLPAHATRTLCEVRAANSVKARNNRLRFVKRKHKPKLPGGLPSGAIATAVTAFWITAAIPSPRTPRVFRSNSRA